MKEQLLFIFIALVIGCVICFFLLIAWIMIGGFLVFVGLMESGNNINTPLLIVMGLVHLAGQIMAYRFAIKESIVG